MQSTKSMVPLLNTFQQFENSIEKLMEEIEPVVIRK